VHALDVQPGDAVCIEVTNAHPLFYKYEFKSEDQELSGPEVPSLPPAWTNVGTTGGKALDALQTSKEGPTAPPLDKYVDLVGKIAEDAGTLQERAQASDRPEPLSALTNPGGDRSRGFRWAQQEIGALRSDLRAHRTTLQNLRRQSSGDNADTIVDALDAYAEAQLEALEAGIKRFTDETPTRRLCTTIQPETQTTMTLSIVQQRGEYARDTGSSVVTVTATANYDRAILEFDPLLLFSYGVDVPSYSLEDGVVAEDGTSLRPTVRAGGALSVNLFNFGERDQIAVGPSIGVALGPDDNYLLSFLGGLSVAVHEKLRIGFGAGLNRVPAKLQDGIAIGEPLPDNVDGIDDIVVRDFQVTAFFMVAFSGLNVPL